jgi:hypothetical protein
MFSLLFYRFIVANQMFVIYVCVRLYLYVWDVAKLVCFPATSNPLANLTSFAALASHDYLVQKLSTSNPFDKQLNGQTQTSGTKGLNYAIC